MRVRRTLLNLPATRIECDEIWSFVGMKARTVPQERRGEPGIGDVWTFTAIDPDSKLMCSWLVGNRDQASAIEFVADLAPRLRNRVQITTDGHAPYGDTLPRPPHPPTRRRPPQRMGRSFRRCRRLHR